MPVTQRCINAANLWVIDMSGQEILPEQPGSGWRLKIGSVLLLLSIVLPLVGVPLTASLDMSAAMTTSVSGALLMGGEVLGVIAVAVMGKSGYAYIKNRVFGLLINNRYGSVFLQPYNFYLKEVYFHLTIRSSLLVSSDIVFRRVSIMTWI